MILGTHKTKSTQDHTDQEMVRALPMNDSMPGFSGWLPYSERVDTNGTLIEIKRRGPNDLFNMDHKAINVFLWIVCSISAIILLWEVFRFLTDVPPKFSTRVLIFNTFTFLFVFKFLKGRFGRESQSGDALAQGIGKHLLPISTAFVHVERHACFKKGTESLFV